MVSFSQLIAFVLTSALIAVVPGPSVLFLVGRALAHGRRVALATAVGDQAGTLVLALGVAVGLGTVLERSVLVYTVVKYAGVAYLVYLGVKALVRRTSDLGHDRATGVRGTRRAVLDGFLVGVANPKTVLFLTAVIPQFVDLSRGGVPLQMVVLGTVFSVITFGAGVAWGIAAGGVRTWFAKSPRRIQAVARAGGLTMIGVGVGVALNGRGA
ncbi:LysE family translocator [Actinosynnema sp. NPDC050436]|uniref:LysE family translocator n=1 Tax=Actinosynnema sp. NPDC050436 TaxID=3155659 RepID=UPI0033ED3FB0